MRNHHGKSWLIKKGERVERRVVLIQQPRMVLIQQPRIYWGLGLEGA